MGEFLLDERAAAIFEEGSLAEPSSLVTSELARLTLNGWSVETGEFWTYVRPAVTGRRVQGWKLHVSATILSAPEVLRACLPILVESQTSFKFAATEHNLDELNGFRTPRGNSGKFITVYPADDEEFRRLAQRLHEATDGMAGPAILSDAPYREGGLVHYRYGAFTGLRILSNDGMYRECILDPDGDPVEDQRLPVFSPPSWAVDPVNAPAEAASGSGVLLNDRFEVRAALRHANKGGVYRATDRRTGAEVIIKEARPFVATDRWNRDVVDLLRHEGKVLRQLAPLGIVPRVVDEFVQDGHCFLAEQFLAGDSLLRRIEGASEEDSVWPSPADVPGLVRELTRLVRAVHAAGVVIRDFSPSNVLLTPDGELRLIDLELAALRTDDGWTVAGGGGTPGFSAPEQIDGATPDPAADLFSLGAMTYYLVTQVDPAFVDDRPAGCPLEERLAYLVGPARAARLPGAVIRSIITGLMRSDPTSRMPLEEVLRLIDSSPPRSAVVEPGPGEEEVLDEERWETLVTGILGHLTANLPAGTEDRPWPETGFGTAADPCTVQHGLAGALAVLARLAEHGRHAPELLDAVLSRITGHLDRTGHRLPGLYFGFAGTAWALFDAGCALDRTDLSTRALELAANLPTSWPSADITHGMSGLGTCLIHLWQQTGDARLLDRVNACADGVLAAAAPGRQIGWTTPKSFDSELAGYRSYGFAHGTAGIGAFLLAAGQATGRTELLTAAGRCGESLLDAAVPIENAAYWPDTPGSDRRMVFWCNGSSGVGTFLTLLHSHDGDPRYRDASVAAGRAVMRSRRRTGTAYCHGLAGNADFLLDLDAATGTGRDWAESLAGLLWARRLDRAGRPVLGDETGMKVTGGYGAGLFGHLSFLLRLRHGGSRLFHLDQGKTR